MSGKHGAAEFVLGGIATCGAGFFTNPLEVVKTRMQLQGELKAKGNYAVHYRNAAHAFYTIAKNEGIISLQSGLVPALWYQFFMNGVRLGTYQVIVNMGMTEDKNGHPDFLKSVMGGAIAGCIGAAVGSPFYMVKTHLQSQAAQSIAVGTQHPHKGMSHAMRTIYGQFGILGLWRGVTAAICRVSVGSAAQLSTFSISKGYVVRTKIFHHESWMNTLIASMASGVIVTCFMTPFDVIATRLYNQGVDARGKGLIYSGIWDCLIKISKKEGFWGFYKGWGASYFRLGPHTVLSFVFWDEIRKNYSKWKISSYQSQV